MCQHLLAEEGMWKRRVAARLALAAGFELRGACQCECQCRREHVIMRLCANCRGVGGHTCCVFEHRDGGYWCHRCVAAANRQLEIDLFGNEPPSPAGDHELFDDTDFGDEPAIAAVPDTVTPGQEVQSTTEEARDFCSSCGSLVSSGARFCYLCGRRLSDVHIDVAGVVRVFAEVGANRSGAVASTASVTDTEREVDFS